MFTTKKIAAVSVINDLVTDSRVNKTCLALIECGYEVVLIGRRLPDSMPVPIWPFKAIRMSFFLRKGPLFYFFFMLRLFLKLLFKRTDLLYANDLDTLLPNFLVARLKQIPIIYDSHELFCDVPELQQEPFKRKIWLKLEGWTVPKLRHCITVNDSIARILSRQYGVRFNVVRNIPAPVEEFKPLSKAELGLPNDKKIILLQGAGINIDRGAEELIDAMTFVEGAILLIIGGGDCWPILKGKVKTLHLDEKVLLIDKVPKRKLWDYTFNADLGLSIDKNTNPNYYNSLPNKVFDYIQAAVPILASRLPEIEALVTHFGVGEFIENHQPEHIATALNSLLFSHRLEIYKANTEMARADLTWAQEKLRLLEVINEAAVLSGHKKNT